MCELTKMPGLCSLAHDICMFLLGTGGVTLADLRAIHRDTQEVHIPHEVKAPWAEAHGGCNFAELLQDVERRGLVARPAAQILYYMVRPLTHVFD